ncbi:MAG: peptidoglycan-binding domain-containing protein [bacterium]
MKKLALLTPVLALALLVLPSVGLAAVTPTLTAQETVANTETASIPAIALTGGTVAIAATSTLTAVAKANLANNDYFILSHTGVAATAVCFYFDVDNSLSSDAGTAQACKDANGVAGGIEIAVSAATDAASVAALINTAINGVTSALTITSSNSGGGILVLTNDTAGAAGNIAVNSGYWAEGVTNAGFTLTALAGGANAIPATTTVVIPAGLPANAGDHSVTVDGVVINLGTSVLTANQVAAALAAATYTGGTSYGSTGAYVVTNPSAANLTFTRANGANGSIVLGDSNYGTTAQVVTFTPGSVIRAKYTVTINDTDYSYSSGTDVTAQQVVEALNGQLASNTDVTCTEDDVMVTCTAAVAGTAFTYSTDVEVGAGAGSTNGGGGGSHHHSSGGSSSSSSSTSGSTTTTTTTSTSVEAQLAALNAQLAALMAQANAMGGVSASFTRDLTIGSSGADVKALQMWLNAHGFMVAATGPGSAGMETDLFGALTQAALAKYQASVGITPAAGYFGPKTRAWIK